MTYEQFIDKLCVYAKTVIAPKTQSKVTQFILGAATVGAGRKALEEYVRPVLSFCGDDIDIESVKASVIAGFKVSGSLPILGGRITLDEGDATDFFSFALR